MTHVLLFIAYCIIVQLYYTWPDSYNYIAIAMLLFTLLIFLLVYMYFLTIAWHQIIFNVCFVSNHLHDFYLTPFSALELYIYT